MSKKKKKKKKNDQEKEKTTKKKLKRAVQALGVALGKLLSALPGASDPELLRASLRELATTERGRLSANQLRELRGRHARWLALLRSGHNVLLHGAGSKRAVLEQLRTEGGL
ncbi:hypothetical protein T492DRAFT_527990 [Pavlovales sp. CCMP2436]|nr:hypothetical protein T492DRAFT_527990 [Pavlovales sp. CCMP2436]